MTLRLRYLTWKLRALCWLLRRLRAGQCGWSEIQKPLTGRAKCVMRPGQGQKSQSLEWEETKREILDSAFRQNFDESCQAYNEKMV
jgi:hypothetical protein